MSSDVRVNPDLDLFKKKIINYATEFTLWHNGENSWIKTIITEFL